MAAALLNMEGPRRSSGGWRQNIRHSVNEMLGTRVTGGAFRPTGSGVPKLEHDRCERSVQMRLYTMSKGQFALVFAIFLLAFVILLMIGLAGPPITAVRQRRASELSRANITNMAVGPIVVSSPILSPYCQQLWIIAQFDVSGSQQGSLRETYKASFQINSEVLATTSYVDASGVLANAHRQGNSQNRSTMLHCEDDVCDEIIMAHIGFLDYSQYHFLFRLYGLQEHSDRFVVQDIVFYFKSYNPSFTRLEVCFRMTLAVVALLATVWFHQNLRSYPLVRWSIEQKWVAALLPALFLFDNPLFPLVILINSALPSAVDSLFQATFLCALLMFWLCVYHGIKQTKRPCLTFYIPKLALVCMLWLAVVAMSVLHRVAALDDVGNGRTSLETSRGFQIFLFVIGSLYLLYLAILVIRSYKELRNLPYFDLRLKFFSIFLLVVIIVTVSISVQRFGVTPALEDNFISHLSTKYGSSAEFMAFYGLLNCYLFAMAFVYSPNPNVVAELDMIDHPPSSASALLSNDSEDDLFSPEMSGGSLRPHFGEGESDGD